MFWLAASRCQISQCFVKTRPPSLTSCQRLRDAGIVVEAQFIVGLENETGETLEETYRMARDWKPDLANWSMWPFSDLFRELGDKVEIFDYEKYNFVTPIIKPDAMDRAELLDRVMHNYRRFYMNKGPVLLSMGRQRRTPPVFARLAQGISEVGIREEILRPRRVNYWEPQSKGKVKFNFDASRKRADMNAVVWKTSHNRKISGPQRAALMACGAGEHRGQEAGPATH